MFLGLDLEGRVLGGSHPPPHPQDDDLQLSNTTVILQNLKKLCGLLVLKKT